MFNSYSNNQKIEFHSVSGLICKSHPKSIICKTGKDPYLLDITRPRTHRDKYGSNYNVISGYCEAVVLQVMICEDGFIVEYMPKYVYESEVLEIGVDNDEK